MAQWMIRVNQSPANDTIGPVAVPTGGGGMAGLTVVSPSGDTTGVTDSANIATAIASGDDVKLARGAFYIASPITLPPNIEFYGPSLGRISAGGGDIATTNAVAIINLGSSWSGAAAIANTAPTTGTACNVWNVHLHDLIVVGNSTTICYDLSNMDWSEIHNLYANGGTVGFKFSFKGNTAPSSTQIPGPRYVHHLYASTPTTYGFQIEGQTQTMFSDLYVNGLGVTPVAFHIYGCNTCMFSNLLGQRYLTTGVDVNKMTWGDASTSGSFGNAFSNLMMIGGTGNTGFAGNGINPAKPIGVIGLGVSTNATPTSGVTHFTIAGQY